MDKLNTNTFSPIEINTQNSNDPPIELSNLQISKTKYFFIAIKSFIILRTYKFYKYFYYKKCKAYIQNFFKRTKLRKSIFAKMSLRFGVTENNPQALLPVATAKNGKTKPKLNATIQLEADLKPTKVNKPPMRNYINGELFYVLGGLHPLKVITKPSDNTTGKVQFKHNALQMTVSAVAGVQSRKKVLNDWYKTLSKTRIKLLAYQYYCYFHFTEPVQIQLMSTTNKWFTTNHTEKIIWIDQELIKLDAKYLEYALASEFCLLFLQKQYKNNKAKIFAEYETTMNLLVPFWQALRKQLETEQHLP